MPKPWEKYQSAQPAAEEAGPWAKFSKPTPAPETFMDRLGGLLTSKGRKKLSDRIEQEKPAAFEDSEASGSLRTGARSLLETSTLGASEPLFGGMRAVDKAFEEGVKAGAQAIRGEPTDYNPLDSMSRGYAADVAQRRQDKSDYPLSDVTGAVGGALMPGPAAALIGKVTGKVGQAASRVGQMAPTFDSATKLGRGANAAMNLGGRVATGAAQGAATGLALEAPRQVIEGSTGYIQHGDQNVPDLADVGKVGALIGGSLPVAGAVGRQAAKGSKWAGKKLMNVFLGPSDDKIEFYLANPQAVNNAKSITELKDKVDDIVEGLRDGVVKGEKSVAEARAQLRDVEQAIQAQRANSNLEYQVTATQIKQQFRDAKKALQMASEKQTQALKGVKAPLDLADEAVQATRDLKDKVVKGSQAATDLLQEGDTILIQSPYRALKSAQERLSIAGAGPATPQAQAAAAEIQKLMDTFGRLPSKLSAKEAKQLLMQIDQSERAVYNSGEFTDDVSNAYRQLRAAIDEQLKTQNPKYAEAMKGVAKDRALMDEVGGFREKGGALSRLGRIANPTAQAEREAFERLGEATGRDFKAPVQRYAEAQGLLKDPATMQRLEQSLPEYKAAQEAENAVRMLEGPEAKNEFLNRTLKSSGLLDRQAQAQGLLSKESQGLLQAQGKLEPFKNITPRSSQSLLERAGRATESKEAQVQLKRQLEELSKLGDTDFLKAVEALRVKEGFQKGAMNGSRNVNLFAAVGGGIGGIASGPYGAAAGASVGAAMGGVVDKFGPVMAKRILDGVLKIQGSPTVQKIQALNIPPEAKAWLSRELAAFNEVAPAKLQKVTDKDTP
jgi:hypothetical protein